MILDCEGVNQRIAAFDKRHDGESAVLDGSWIRFADGALREKDPLGAIIEPPSDPNQCAQLRRRYRKLLLDRAVRAFDQARQNYAAMAQSNLQSQYCGAAPDVAHAVGELKQLLKKAQLAKAAYDEADKAVDATKPQRQRELQKLDADNRRANEALLAGIRDLEI
jgi:hypothetical protein